MQIIENSKIKEKIYIEKLKNGLVVVIIPKKNRKKYIVWGTKFGSIDNKFEINDNQKIEVPDGIAHYLEHKLFEQKNGTNSLDVLSSFGVDANAYTTNNHTSFLYECTDNFYEALDEFMDYVQNPYFTDENIEKERGIISQEIMMYDDYPEWAMYMNAMRCMYHNNEIKIDIAGSQESILKINKENLYTIYNSFYKPENMIIAVAGDFIPEQIINEIKKRVILVEGKDKVKRIYHEEPEDIVKNRIEKKMDISIPSFIMAFKDNPISENKIKKDIAIEVLANILFGKSSKFFKNLYESGKIISEPSVNYEFADTYAHLLIQVQTNFVDDVINAINDRIEELKQTGIDEENFEIIKRKIYGELVKDYNDISNIANCFVGNYFRNINTFEYFEEFESISKEYVENVLKDVFCQDKEIISIIKSN